MKILEGDTVSMVTIGQRGNGLFDNQNVKLLGREKSSITVIFYVETLGLSGHRSNHY